MSRSHLSAWIALPAALAAAGCVTVHPGSAEGATWEGLRAEGGWLLVDAVPFAAQESTRDCGAACLSMVLARWGVEAPPAALAAECGADARDGIRAADLRDAARRRGFSAFLFRGGVEDLRHELSRGRPVVVGVLKTLGPMTLPHFEVVVGLHPAGGRVAALDPARGLVADALPAFAEEWSAAGGVTLVVFRTESAAAARAGGGP